MNSSKRLFDDVPISGNPAKANNPEIVYTDSRMRIKPNKYDLSKISTANLFDSNQESTTSDKAKVDNDTKHQA